MGVFKRGRFYWYSFMYQGERFRESTKQTNKKAALEMEAARRTALAKGDMGLQRRNPVPVLSAFADRDFRAFVKSRFADKPKTLEYYENGLKSILAFDGLATARLDEITSERIAVYAGKRRADGLQVSSVNRELEVLRRMLKLAAEWGKVEKALPAVRMLPGERHRERVLSADEEGRYFAAASSAEMIRHHSDPFLVRDVAALLLDCGMRPEEVFRLRWEQVRDGYVHVLYGKTANARRSIPVMTDRVRAAFEMRRATANCEWVFPAPTKSGHIEKSSVKKQHQRVCILSAVERFELYVLRHTCLTRWSAFMDPYTLGYLAGHSDFSMTRRYVHPQPETVRSLLERARPGPPGRASKVETTPSSPPQALPM